MFGLTAKQKMDEYFGACSSIFETNTIAINGKVVPFQPGSFPNMREFLRAVVAFAAYSETVPKKKG